MKKLFKIINFLLSVMMALFISSAISNETGSPEALPIVFTLIIAGGVLSALGMAKRSGILAIDMTSMSSRISVPNKMIYVNRQYGNTNVGNQQSTSRVIYHALPLDGRTLFEFFRNVGSGTGLAGEVGLPFNNISENKLQVEESLVIRRIYFHLLLMQTGTSLLASVATITGAGLVMIYGGDYSLMFDTAMVQKPNPLSSQIPALNKNSNHTTNEWIWFDNDATIIPKVQFQYNL